MNRRRLVVRPRSRASLWSQVILLVLVSGCGLIRSRTPAPEQSAADERNAAAACISISSDAKSRAPLVERRTGSIFGVVYDVPSSSTTRELAESEVRALNETVEDAEHSLSFIWNRTKKLRDAAAVLCRGNQSIVIGKCSYTGGHTVSRTRDKKTYTLIEWPSGALIAQDEFVASDPGLCPYETAFLAVKPGEYSVDLHSWLKRYWSYDERRENRLAEVQREMIQLDVALTEQVRLGGDTSRINARLHQLIGEEVNLLYPPPIQRLLDLFRR